MSLDCQSASGFIAESPYPRAGFRASRSRTRDYISAPEDGDGIEKLLGQLIRDDLVRYDDRLRRYAIALGKRADPSESRRRIKEAIESRYTRAA
jgi:hypothetical protein